MQRYQISSQQPTLIVLIDLSFDIFSLSMSLNCWITLIDRRRRVVLVHDMELVILSDSANYHYRLQLVAEFLLIRVITAKITVKCTQSASLCRSLSRVIVSQWPALARTISIRPFIAQLTFVIMPKSETLVGFD